MPAPGLFPLYPDGRYHVSISFPGPPPTDKLSDISKLVDATGPAILLIPNVEFLKKFIEGDIGIGNSILKPAFTNNFSSPAVINSERAFKTFAELSKIEISDINKYKTGPTSSSGLKSRPKYKMPTQEIKVSSEFDFVGIKGFEKVLLKSIFETQKPYLEIAKLTVSSIAKSEDIIARILPLALPIGSPLTTQSQKPVGNSGGVGQKSLGFGGGAEIKSALAKLAGLSKKGGETKIGSEGQPIREIKKPIVDPTQESGQANFSNDNDSSTNPEVLGYTYSIVSAIYSTGKFDPASEYTYTYKNLPPVEDPGTIEQELNLSDDGDPYKGFKPDCLILGFFDSKGVPLNPLASLNGYDNNGNVAPTQYKVAQWLSESPKWKFKPGMYVWPVYGEPKYRWVRYPLEYQDSFGQPGSSDPHPAFKKFRYGDPLAPKNNILNGEPAIKGDPIITDFSPLEINENKSFYTDLVEFKLATTTGLTEADKSEARAAVVPQIDIPAQLENIFLYGQSKASVYKKLNIPGLKDDEDPYPSNMKLSFKPMKIYSAPAAADPRLLSAFGSRMNDTTGNIWIDPESDYETKVIRVDPTTKIKYTLPGSSEPLIAEIKSFIKNITTIRMSDGRPFNMEIRRTKQPDDITTYTLYSSQQNMTEYYLENWNYEDPDGLLREDIAVQQNIIGYSNLKPVQENKFSYRMTIWSEQPTPYYDTIEYHAAIIGSNQYLELEKQLDGTWEHRKFYYEIGTFQAIIDLVPTLETTGPQIDFFYEKIKENPNFIWPTVGLVLTKPYSVTASQFGTFSDSPLSAWNKPQEYKIHSILPGTYSPTASYTEKKIIFEGDIRDRLKYAKSFTVRTVTEKENSNFSFRDINLTLQGNDSVFYNSVKNLTEVKVDTLHRSYIVKVADLKETFIRSKVSTPNYINSIMEINYFNKISVSNFFNAISDDTKEIKIYDVISKNWWIHQIKYDVVISDLFSRKRYIPFDGLTKLIPDSSIVEVKDSKIIKWFYVTPHKLENWFSENIDVTDMTDSVGYGNGELKNNLVESDNSLTFTPYTDTAGTIIEYDYDDTLDTSNAQQPPTGLQPTTTDKKGYKESLLPKNGYRREITFYLSDNFNGLWDAGAADERKPITKVVDKVQQNYQIRVATPDNPNGAVIDPLQVFNERLKSPKPFINEPGTKYGYGSSDKPQEIGVIQRFMLTEFDTESYYILEGVLPEIADELLGSTQSNAANPPQASNAGGYYKISHAIGAIKVFISLLTEIFSKLIPSIKRLLKLLQDPRSFITDIVTEKLGEVFSFLGPEAFDAFKNAQKLAAPSTPGTGGVGANFNTPSNPTGKLDEKKSKKLKKIEEHFKKSKMNGVVFVYQDTLKYKSVLDGIGTIPFEMFGKDLGFGLELNTSSLPNPPIKLVFPQNITTSKLKSQLNDAADLFNEGQNVKGEILDNLAKAKSNVGSLSKQNKLPDGTQLNANDYKILDIKYSTGEFINGVDYNYVYITKDVENLLAEADELTAKGTEEDLEKAKERLEAAQKLDPDNQLIEDKLKELQKSKSIFDKNLQPLLKFILGFVSLPIQIVSKIIQAIMDFFKSLTNPIKLPSAIAKFLSFQWILEFFIPPGPPLPGLFKAINIKFRPELLASWIALINIPNPTKLVESMNQKIAEAGGLASSLSNGVPSANANAGNTNSKSQNKKNITKEYADKLKVSPKPIASAAFPWPMPVPKGEHFIPDDFEIADLSKFYSCPFMAKLPTYTARQLRATPKNPISVMLPSLCLIEKIINSIIDFFWSVLGIEAIIKPPHIKICRSIDPKTVQPEDLVKIMNGEIPNGATSDSDISGTPADSVTEGTESFIYEVTFDDGTKRQFVDYDELTAFMNENGETSFDVQF